MNAQKKKGLWQIGFGGILLLVVVVLYWYGNKVPTVSSFAICAEKYPVMESYPRQCKTPDGRTFREDIGNELEKDNLIRIETPRPNAVIGSPLVIRGVARGNWYFEASFPVRLVDASGKDLAREVAQAKGDWMTTEFVPFEATLTFTTPAKGLGALILEKDNPSGLSEHADELRIPIVFAGRAPTTPPVAKSCVISGCSSQICGEEEMMSTCEFREEYACYRKAACERQTSGKCGWTDTAELRACIDSTR